jgi:hypothetical protein
MTLTWTIDTDARHVRLRYESDPTLEEWMAVMSKVLDRPEFRPPTSLLVERRGAAVQGCDYIRRTVEAELRKRARELAGTWEKPEGEEPVEQTWRRE